MAENLSPYKRYKNREITHSEYRILLAQKSGFKTVEDHLEWLAIKNGYNSFGERRRSEATKWRDKNREKVNNYAREGYKRNRQELVEKSRLWKENNPDKVLKYREDTREIHRKKGLDYIRKVRLQVLSHYSPELKCACCGESHYEFLTIDHINNDGAEHRKEMNLMGGFSTYKWLIDNNYPSGFQVLCYNCNMSKVQNDENLLSRKSLNRRKHRKLVIDYYSNSNIPHCSCCNETTYKYLAIDHINGGGHKHRENIGNKYIVDWIIENNYPEGFRILCHNCNNSLGSYGYCPHDKEEKKINTDIIKYKDIVIDEEIFKV